MFHFLIPKHGRCLKSICLTGCVPCSAPREGEDSLPCSTPQASVRCLGFEAPALDLAGVTAVWICYFPGVLPADIMTASMFVLLNRAPTL